MKTAGGSILVSKIISGGQTGVDRAALDVAIELGIEIGGWCPRGRRAEDGPIDGRYGLIETPTRRYAQRTEWNVRDSDGTLILYRAEMSGGTALTARYARDHGRPTWTVDLERPADIAAVRGWIAAHPMRVLNIAGPRESGEPGVYEQAFAFLPAILVHRRARGLTSNGTVSDAKPSSLVDRTIQSLLSRIIRW